MATSQTPYLADGAMDFSAGADSSLVTTLQSTLNVNGLPRNALAWIYNGTVRGGGITQRTGWQPLTHILPGGGRWQGWTLYEPDSGNPYAICSISGHIYSVRLDPPYTVTELANTLVPPWTGYGTNHLTIDGNSVVLENPLFNPPDAEMSYFCQGENFLVIQAGDGVTLPLFWNGATLVRSIGITTNTPSGMTGGINQIPSATCMCYHAGRFWYAQNRQVSAGDMVGGPSGTVSLHLRDSILNVTENPLCFGGDGFSLPTNSGNIRALREEVNLNESVAQTRLLIWTRKSVFALSVPPTRTDWIAANSTNQPTIVPVQRANGTTGDRSVVASNGDWFYQSFEPGIRSLITAVRYYAQWGNTPISQPVQRALAFNDRGLMRFSGGIVFDNRMLQLIIPEVASDGVNVVHRGIVPLDFDIVSSLTPTTPPVWEGAYDGLPFLQLAEGDFGGLPRAFGAILSTVDGSIDIWELTTASRTEGGDNRLTWGFESPAFTWSERGLEFKLKQLMGGEMWVDKLFGTVDINVEYREDADPCWRFWHHQQICVARNCEEHPDPACLAYPYPQLPFREGYRYPVVFPEPPRSCDSMGIRPSSVGYQFQVRVIIKGWCRVRGLMLYALEREKPQYQGIGCQPVATQDGMFKLPKIPWNYQTNPPTPPPVTPTVVILEDPMGGFWRVITSVNGDVGTQSDPGPKTPDVILVDPLSGFWKLIAGVDGSRGAQSDPGPATLPPIIADGFGGNWKLIVDVSGNVGAMSV